MGEGQELTKAWYLRPAEPVWEEERQTLLDMNKVTIDQLKYFSDDAQIFLP